MNAKTNDTKKYYDVTHTMGCTPLHVAAKRGHVEVTEVIHCTSQKYLRNIQSFWQVHKPHLYCTKKMDILVNGVVF